MMKEIVIFAVFLVAVVFLTSCSSKEVDDILNMSELEASSEEVEVTVLSSDINIEELKEKNRVASESNGRYSSVSYNENILEFDLVSKSFTKKTSEGDIINYDSLGYNTFLESRLEGLKSYEDLVLELDLTQEYVNGLEVLDLCYRLTATYTKDGNSCCEIYYINAESYILVGISSKDFSETDFDEVIYKVSYSDSSKINM